MGNGNGNETRVIHAIDNPLDYVFCANRSRLIYEVMREKKDAEYENFKDFKWMFRVIPIPEIKILRLGKDVQVGFGNVARHNSFWSYMSQKFRDEQGLKVRLRKIRRVEQPPHTLNNLSLEKGFTYRLTFKCAFCKKTSRMRLTVKTDKHLLRKRRATPTCHNQIMYIKKVKRVKLVN